MTFESGPRVTGRHLPEPFISWRFAERSGTCQTEDDSQTEADCSGSEGFEVLMSPPHTIRLQGPWEAAPLSPAGAPFLKIHLPGEVERLSYFSGGFRLKRRFHRPTGLTEADVITLILPVAAPRPAVQLNGYPLSADEEGHRASRWRITLLESSNILTIAINDPSSEAWAQWRDPVLLEIHSPEPAGGE